MAKPTDVVFATLHLAKKRKSAQNRKLQISRFLGASLLMLLSAPALLAQTDLPQHFTLDGRLLEPGSSTEPLLDNATVMTIQVLNPAKDCILYEEEQSVNTLGTNGYFSIRVGSNTSATKRTTLDSNNSMNTVFYNRTTAISGKNSGGGACSYTPSAGEERFFRFFVKPSSASVAVQLSDDMPINSVPQAIVAQTLQGYSPTNFFRTSVTSTQAKLDNLLTTEYNSITDLISGASPLYLPNDPAGTVFQSRNADPVAPTAGQVWYNSSDNKFKFYDGVSTVDVTSGAGTGTVTSVIAGAGLAGGTITTTGTISIADGGVTTVKLDDASVTEAKLADGSISTSKLVDANVTNAKLATGIDAAKITVGTLPVGVVPTGTDDTKLPLVGGTMTGIITMGDETNFAGFDLLNTGHITMNGQKTITIGRYDAGQQTTLINNLTGVNAGALWFNTTTGKLMFWSGTQEYEISETTGAGGDITAVNTNTGSGLTGGSTSGPVTLAINVDGTSIEIATNTLQIADGGVSTVKLADVSVSTDKLVDGAVASAKLANDAITTGKILDGTIVDADISATAGIAWSKISKIGASASDLGAVPDTRLISTSAGSGLSGGGDLTADRSLSVNVDGATVEVNGSNVLRVRDAGISTSKLADASVTEVKLADASVSTNKLVDGAITSAKIADGTIVSADVNTISIGKISSVAAEYFSYMPAGTECNTGEVLKWNATNDRWLCDIDAVGVSSHAALADLGADDHTQYVLLAGRGAGQSIRGGTAGNANLTLESTSNATKGFVVLQPSGGNVGIGTAAPTETLQVHAASGADSSVALSDGDVDHGLTDIAQTDQYFQILPRHSIQGGSTVRGISDHANGIGLNLEGTIGVVDPTDSVPAVAIRGYRKSTTDRQALNSLETILSVTNGGNPVPAFAVLGSGNVGVGLANPVANLQVNSSSFNDNGNIRIQSSTLPSLLLGTGTVGWGVSIDTTDSNKLKIGSGTTNISTATSRMTIDTSGNVGIGTTVPTAKLEVDGTIKATAFEGPLTSSVTSSGAGTNLLPSLTFTGDPDTGFYNTGSNDTISVTAGGANIFNFTANGLTSSTTGGALVKTADGDANSPTFSFAGDPDTGWFRPAADTMAAATDGTERMRITSTGNVGIGTTSPVDRMSVYAATTDGSRRIAIASGDIGNSSEYGLSLENQNTQGIAYLNVHTQNAGANAAAFTIRTGHGAAETAYERAPFTIKTDTGNVGVGTTSPDSLLHMASDSSLIFKLSPATSPTGSFTRLRHSATIGVFDNTVAAGASTLQLDPIPADNVSAATIRLFRNTNTSAARTLQLLRGDGTATVDSQIQSGTAGTSFFAANGGNVGIGTTTPGSRLQVGQLGPVSYTSVSMGPAYYAGGGPWNTSFIGFNLNGGGNSYTTGSDNANSGGGAIFGNMGGDLSFSTLPTAGPGVQAYTGADIQSAIKMRITSSGNVGIGTTVPTAKLDVVGTIKATSFEGPLTSTSSSTAAGYAINTDTDNAGSDGGVSFQTNSVTQAQITANGRVLAGAGGGLSTPGLSFLNDPDSGMFNSSANTLSLVSGGVEGLRVNTIASGVNYVEMTPAAAGGSPVIASAGADTNVGLRFRTKGTGVIALGNSNHPIADPGVVNINTDAAAATMLNLFNRQMVDGSTSAIQFQFRDSVASVHSYARILAGTSDVTNTAESGYLSLMTSNAGSLAERVRIAPTGNVGIGTTNPSSQLEIVNTVGGLPRGVLSSQYTSDTGSALLMGRKARGTAASPSTVVNGDALLNVLAQGYDGTSWLHTSQVISYVDGVVSTGSVPTAIAFNTGASGGGSERMRISSGGNVGIGTTVPDAKMHIVSDGAGANFRVSDVNGVNRLNFGADFNLSITSSLGTSNTRFYSDGGSDSYINALGGNVGIGTTAPGSALEVNGSIVSKSTAPRLEMFDSDATADTGRWAVSSATANTFRIQALTDAGAGGGHVVDITRSGNSVSAFQLGTVASPVFKVDVTAGNVGIGTTNPSVKLHVTGGTDLDLASGGFLIVGATNSANLAIDDNEIQGRLNGAASTLFLNHDGGPVTIGGAGTSNLTVYGSSTTCSIGNGTGATNCTSDSRLKDNVVLIPDAVHKILSLRGVEFDWNEKANSPGKHGIGVIAQEVEAVFPTVVIEDESTGYKMVDYAALVAPLIEAFKEFYYRWSEDSKAIHRDLKIKEREIASIKMQMEKSKVAQEKQIEQLQQENAVMKKHLCKKDPSAPFCK